MLVRNNSFCENHHHPHGNTCLHLVVSLGNYVQVKSFIYRAGDEAVSNMAKIINNAGKHAYEYIRQDLMPSEIYAIKVLLFPYVIPVVQAKLSEEINLQDVLTSYPDPVLSDNLRLACAAVNAARKCITQTCTHPEINGSLISFISQRQSQLNLNRSQSLIKAYETICKHSSASYRNISMSYLGISVTVDLTEQLWLKTLKAFVTIPHKTGLGNCGELMYSALYHALQHQQLFHQSTIVEPYTISNGNHCILLIGREPGSDCSNIGTWGKKVIVADPLLGQIYPFNELAQRLVTYQVGSRGNCQYNLIFSFNPFYHALTTPFLARPQANLININMTGNDFAFYFVNDLMRKEKNSIPVRRVLLFYEVIIPRLRQALAYGLITEKQVKDLIHPALTLKAVFSREKKFEKLRKHLVTLQKVDLEKSIEVEKKCATKTPLRQHGIFAAKKTAEVPPIKQESKRTCVIL